MTSRHFTDALFNEPQKDELLINKYSTRENLDWVHLDVGVKEKFGAGHPGDGPTYIATDGTFINNFGDVHADLSYWAATNGLILVPEEILNSYEVDNEDFLDFIHSLASNPREGYLFVGEPLNYMRCNNYRYQSYVILPAITNKYQLDSLEKWLDHLYTLPLNIRPACVEFSSYDDNVYNAYDLDKYTPEELIKVVKRYYSSGILYESKTDIE